MQHLNNPRLLISACGLLASIAGGLFTVRSESAAVPPEPAAASSPVAVTQPGEQQTFVWGYQYSPELLPDLSWLQLQPGTQYRLFDQLHQCIGIITPAGETKLIHHFPAICQPSPAPQSGEVAHG